MDTFFASIQLIKDCFIMGFHVTYMNIMGFCIVLPLLSPSYLPFTVPSSSQVVSYFSIFFSST